MKLSFEEYHRKKSLLYTYMYNILKKTEKYIDNFNILNYMFFNEIKKEFRAYIRKEFI